MFQGTRAKRLSLDTQSLDLALSALLLEEYCTKHSRQHAAANSVQEVKHEDEGVYGGFLFMRLGLILGGIFPFTKWSGLKRRAATLAEIAG